MKIRQNEFLHLKSRIVSFNAMSSPDKKLNDGFWLAAVFFLSGTSALIYQIVWIRMFGFTFGVTVYAMSTVLSAFMAGLAVGSRFFGKMADRCRSPLNLLIGLETGIGLFALAFPFLFSGMTRLYGAVNEWLHPGFYQGIWIRFLFGFLLLLLPATLMGGTLPVVSRLFIRRMSGLGGAMGILHGWNQFGSFFGCLLTGYALVALWGLNAASRIAAVMNLFCGMFLFVMRNRIGNSGSAPETAGPDSPVSSSPAASRSRFFLPGIVAIFTIQGFTTLSYEVTWTRILSVLSLDKSLAFTSMMIAVFLFGLSAGSFIAGRRADRSKDPLLLLAGIEAVIGILAIAMIPILSGLFNRLIPLRPFYAEHWWRTIGKENGLFFLVLLLPILFMGMTFPIVARIYADRFLSLGRKIGVLGFWDTAGSAGGTVVAGFLLIPLLGMAKAGLFTAGINLLLAAALVGMHPRPNAWVKGIVLSVLLCIGIWGYLWIPERQTFRHWDTRQPGDRLLFYSEDEGAAVAVVQHLDGVKELAINGAVTAFAEYGDMRVHRLLAAIPLLLHPSPANALVIGLGMGVTCQTLLQPGMQSVECAEISRGVVDACRACFSAENGGVLDDPRIRIIQDDGRSVLQSSPKRYDIITSNAVHARLSGNLYTRDFYSICRSRLAPNGVMCQWMSTNWCTEDEYKMLIRAFLDVFPRAALWRLDAGNVLLVGKDGRSEIDVRRWMERIREPKMEHDLQGVDLSEPYAILAQAAGSGKGLAAYAGQVKPETDDRPLAEFSRVVSKARNPSIIEHMLGLPADTAALVFRWGGKNPLPDSIDRKFRIFSGAESLHIRAILESVFAGNPAEAVHLLEEAVRLEPGEYRFHKLLAILHYRMRDFAPAEAEMKTALSIHPDFADDRVHLGMVYYDWRKFPEAESVFRKALEAAPDHPLALFYLALIEGSMGQTRSALSRLEKAVRLFPDFSDAHFNLGILHQMRHERDPARAAFRRCLELDPRNVEAGRRLEALR
jgi:spermidine synthase